MFFILLYMTILLALSGFVFNMFIKDKKFFLRIEVFNKISVIDDIFYRLMFICEEKYFSDISDRDIAKLEIFTRDNGSLIDDLNNIKNNKFNKFFLSKQSIILIDDYIYRAKSLNRSIVSWADGKTDKKNIYKDYSNFKDSDKKLRNHIYNDNNY